MLPRLALSCAALGCFLSGGAFAQCSTGRTVLPERGAWTGRVVVGPDGVRVRGSVDLPHARLSFHTGRTGSPVVVHRGGRGAWASPVPPPPVVVIGPRRGDPWCETPTPRRVVIQDGPSPIPVCQPVCEPAPRPVNVLLGGCEPSPCTPPRRETRVVVGQACSPTATATRPTRQEPIPWAEPAAPCPTAARGPADWSGQRRAPRPAAVAVDPLDPARDPSSPPPAGLLADELILALASEDLPRACLLAQWLEGRPHYARLVEQAFYARTPSPSLLREMSRRLRRDCRDCPGRGSLVRLLGAEGADAQ